ncbi:MAG: acylphosphatase [Selenomonadaceae bacterium]|nr:acylphosphatase [Selenomonadaceae bacterium]
MGEVVRYFGRATGRVQGVGFRYFVQQNARELRMTGWVKNMDDGSVTMELQGNQDQIDDLEKRILKGNYFVHVNELKLEQIAPVEKEKLFDIRY